MANARANESSDASSSVNVPAVSIKKNGPLPEEWTLPHEHSMEKREKYEVLFIFCSLVFNYEFFFLSERTMICTFLFFNMANIYTIYHTYPHSFFKRSYLKRMGAYALKSHCINCLISELGIGNLLGNHAYTRQRYSRGKINEIIGPFYVLFGMLT